VGRAVAPHLLYGFEPALGKRVYWCKKTFSVAEAGKNHKVGAGRKVRAGQGTVVANGHRGLVPILGYTAEWEPGDPRESATENTQPMASIPPRGTGNGEMAR